MSYNEGLNTVTAQLAKQVAPSPLADPTPEEIEAVAEAVTVVLANNITFSDKQLTKAALIKFIELRRAK